MIQSVMISVSDLARRWGRSTKWIRSNIIKPRAMTVYGIGQRNPTVSLIEVKILEERVRVKAEPSARARLERILTVGREIRQARSEKGTYTRSEA